MNAYKIIFISIISLISFIISMAYAEIEIQIPERYKTKEVFSKNINDFLSSLENSSVEYLRRFIKAAKESPEKIFISPISNNPKTWHSFLDRKRSHTEPLDGKAKRLGRTIPTSCVIYVDPEKVIFQDKSGVLVHELVHAIDLAYGRYNRDYKIRERRAVFMQNLWRDVNGYSLRKTYHSRFSVIDYQQAKQKGIVGQYIKHILNGTDFPNI